MKKVLTAVVAGSMVVGSAMGAASFTADFANAHIFRGATVTDEFVFQPGVELSGFGMPENYGTFTLGAWGSTAPFDSDGTQGYDSIYETDWYLVYALPQFVEGLDLYFSYTQYQYSFGLDEKEVGLGVGYEVAGFELGASANFMTDNRNPWTQNQVYIPFYADYEFDISEELDVSAGALISFMMQGDGNAAGANGLDDGFNHYELYGAVDYDLSEMWSLGFSLSFIGQGSDKVLTDQAHDVSLLGVLSVGCEM